MLDLNERENFLMRRLWLMPLFIMLTLGVYCWGIGGFGFIDPYETLFSRLEPNINNFINSIAFFILGKSELAGRIIQLVLGLACACTAALTAKILFHSRKITQISFFIILTSPLYFIVSRLNLPDIFFASSFTLCLFCYIYKIQNLDNIFKYRNLAANLFFYSGMALASLSGGFIKGTLAPLSIVISHILIINWRWRNSSYKTINFSDLISPLGMALYAIIISPLFLNNYKLSSDIFFAHNINKFYLLAFCPWIIFIFIYAKKLFKLLFNFNNANALEPETQSLTQDDAALLCLWAALAFIFNFPDLTACIIPIAILIAVLVLENIFESVNHRIFKKFVFYLLCLCAVLSLICIVKAFNNTALYKSHKDIAKIANEYLSYENNPDINLLYYGDIRGLEFYLNHKITNINDADIGDWDVKANNNNNLRKLWNGAKRILLIIKRSSLDEFINIIGREPVKVGESAGDILLTNY
ncbi:MAG: glycosyltransferase family 39 protein [Synergistaceae bacterium]|nr:glycosyltransferase family 39 protein [Synergistaceae bacterium]